MKVTTSTGAIETNELSTKVNINMVKLEEAARNNPLSIDNFPIGYVIPLGTLGNAQNQQEQFSSNFHLVAYTIAKDLRDLSIDFSDFNVNTDQNAQGQVLKLQKRLDELAIRSLGDNWRVTIFNVSLQTTIDSMCKSRQDVDAMAKAMDDLYKIIESRIKGIANSNEKNPIHHEIVELFYAPLKALSTSVIKIVEPRSKSASAPLGMCNEIVIENLIYDDYANGLRLLANKESFASSKIRRHTSNELHDVILLVLKARILGDDISFRPIRQFAGKSRISVAKTKSGCSERIIYNIVNKNYKHWSFISLPGDFKISLSNID